MIARARLSELSRLDIASMLGWCLLTAADIGYFLVAWARYNEWMPVEIGFLAVLVVSGFILVVNRLDMSAPSLYLRVQRTTIVVLLTLALLILICLVGIVTSANVSSIVVAGSGVLAAGLLVISWCIRIVRWVRRRIMEARA